MIQGHPALLYIIRIISTFCDMAAFVVLNAVLKSLTSCRQSQQESGSRRTLYECPRHTLSYDLIKIRLGNKLDRQIMEVDR